MKYVQILACPQPKFEYSLFWHNNCYIKVIICYFLVILDHLKIPDLEAQATRIELMIKNHDSLPTVIAMIELGGSLVLGLLISVEALEKWDEFMPQKREEIIRTIKKLIGHGGKVFSQKRIIEITKNTVLVSRNIVVISQDGENFTVNGDEYVAQ